MFIANYTFGGQRVVLCIEVVALTVAFLALATANFLALAAAVMAGDWISDIYKEVIRVDYAYKGGMQCLLSVRRPLHCSIQCQLLRWAALHQI